MQAKPARGVQGEPAPRAGSEPAPIKNAPRERKKDSCAIDDQFETFWRAYPSRRPHTNPKKTARQKFEAAVKRGVLPATIIQAVGHYATYVERERVEARFVKQATTWLNQECWSEYQEAPPASSGDSGRL